MENQKQITQLKKQIIQLECAFKAIKGISKEKLEFVELYLEAHEELLEEIFSLEITPLQEIKKLKKKIEEIALVKTYLRENLE